MHLDNIRTCARLRVIPQDLLTNSTMPTIGSIMICPLIIHMGTLIPLRTIRKQWRAVCINLIGLLITAALILIVGSLILGYQTAAATVGPATGGTIAFLVTSAKLKQLGLVSLVALPAGECRSAKWSQILIPIKISDKFDIFISLICWWRHRNCPRGSTQELTTRCGV
ncbi:hypothetical protein AAC03nite_02670 [Alicyclobacillus acidoterrestris]|nr:hypothetical protein AAC03nite_02670 [Alicyclobacillus acidoterrestris]